MHMGALTLCHPLPASLALHYQTAAASGLLLATISITPIGTMVINLNAFDTNN